MRGECVTELSVKLGEEWQGYGWVREGPICQATEIRLHPMGRRHFMGDFVDDGFGKGVGLKEAG